MLRARGQNQDRRYWADFLSAREEGAGLEGAAAAFAVAVVAAAAVASNSCNTLAFVVHTSR